MQRTKAIKEFCTEDEGFFLDLEDTNSSVAVNISTGEVLLDEGEGDNRYHGAIIFPGSFKSFTIGKGYVFLRFGSITHELGQTSDLQKAELWVHQANYAISEIKLKLAEKILSEINDESVKNVQIQEAAQLLEDVRIIFQTNLEVPTFSENLQKLRELRKRIQDQLSMYGRPKTIKIYYTPAGCYCA